MEDILLAPILTWMQAHPVWSARVAGLAIFLLGVANVCKMIENRFRKQLKGRHRLKTLLRAGQAVGNVVWGLVALGRAFVDNVDPDTLDKDSEEEEAAGGGDSSA